RPIGLTFGAEAVEVQLVQDHRIGGDELFALETVDHKDGRGGEVERGHLRGDRGQAFDGAAVVVLPVARDQLLREAPELLRITRQRLDVVRHGYPPPIAPRIVRSSKAVIESAFVHSPTRPDLKRESRWSR